MKQLSRTQEKTMHRFIDAFFSVRQTKPLNKITVRDIVDQAGYNRSSFYLYFTDVYDLADAAEDAVIRHLTEYADREFSQGEKVSLESFMSRMALETSGYADEIYLLSDSKSFRDKFMGVLRPNFAKAAGLDPDSRNYDYLVSLFFSIMLHNISYRAQHKDEYSLSEIADITRAVFLPGLRQLKAAE